MIRKRSGQTSIELLMILPVFMLMLFFVLELGNIAYHTIIAHHAAYEMARVGSMVAVRKPGGMAEKSRIEAKLREQVRLMFSGRPENVSFTIKTEETSKDPQSSGHVNEDLIVTLNYSMYLIFPGTSFILADPPDKRLARRNLQAVVRMPIERPLLN
ncbi:hypothetical protein Dip510_000996 [Elusimicrobium posterum]|uniref:TadE family protein n=1 Tax=Elusimicrobium posterum TaxID=3116653 RepID=UPI003C738325